MLTHIDLFAGISGFGYGFEKAGIKTVAHVEIDPKCREVIARHFPESVILDDVCKAGKHNLPYADIISFGSPCQDLSIAGKREGIKGERSGLFFEAVRIVSELQPRYAIWENVPGAFSSNGGRDFQSVISALIGSDVPMPRSGRWARAGVVRNGQKELAWRILDAQYHGVAQRRRRVIAVLCLRGDSASEILFEREGMRWDPPARRKAGESASGNAAPSLTASNDPSRSPQSNEVTEQVHAVMMASMGFIPGQSADARSLGESEELSPTVKGEGGGSKAHVVFAQNQRDEVRDLGDVAGALAAQPGVHQQNYVAYPINLMAATRPEGSDQNRQTFGVGADGDPAFTIQENHSHGVAYTVRTAQTSANGHGVAEEVTHTLDGAMGQAVAGTFQETGQGYWQAEEIGATLRVPNGSGSLQANLVAGTLDRKSCAANYGAQANETEFLVVGTLATNTGPNGHDAGNFLSNQAVDAGYVIPAVMAHGQANAEIVNDGSPSLTLNHEAPIAFVPPVWQFHGQDGSYRAQNETAPTVANTWGAGGNNMPFVGVRRLTPTECSRLQGFPDDWNKYGANMSLISDSTRYKQLGNAICTKVAEWVGRRIVEVS